MAAYYNEHNPHAAQWLRNLIAAGHIAPGDVDERSVVDVQPSELDGYTQCHFFAGVGGWSAALRLAGWSDNRSCWTGSCPCQPFSVAGERKGFADERHLWPAFYRLIAECRPAIVLGEQVAGRAGLEWLAAVRADLEAIGYACGAADLAAASVGAQHVRKRIYWLADAAEPGAFRPDQGRAASPCTGAAERARGSDAGLRARFLECADPDAVGALDGLPRSMGDLRAIVQGFGNAIVPQIAAQFIRAAVPPWRDP